MSEVVVFYVYTAVVGAAVCAAAWLVRRRRAVVERQAAADCVGPVAVAKVKGGWPWFGHAILFGKDPAGFLKKCRAEYGAFFAVNLVGKNYTFVQSKALRKAFFGSREDSLSFKQANLLQLAPDFTVGRDAILNTWHLPVMRQQLSPAGVQAFYERLEEEVNQVLFEKLGPARKTVLNDTQALAWDLVAACSAVAFLGPELGRREDIRGVFKSFHKKCFAVLEASVLLPHSLLGLVKGARDIPKDKAVICGAVEPEVKRRRAAIVAGEGDSLPHDVLTAMIQHRVKCDQGPDHDQQQQQQLRKLSAAEISERILTFVFASMVTTAGAMTHALYDLAGRQEQWGALVEEQRLVVTKHGSGVSLAALEAMPQLHAFLWESLRLAAPPVQHTRVALKDTNLAGLAIPKGAYVVVSGLLNNSDPSLFPEPDAFSPERFLVASEGGGEKREAAAGSVTAHAAVRLMSSREAADMGFFPFGYGGRHVCPGRHFAMSEVRVALITLLRNYHVKTVSGGVPPYRCVPADTTRVAEPVLFERLAAGAGVQQPAALSSGRGQPTPLVAA